MTIQELQEKYKKATEAFDAYELERNHLKRTKAGPSQGEEEEDVT